MKKIILILMTITSTLALAMQSGLAEYRYTQGNYSFTVIDRQEFDALGTVHDKKVAFMDHTGGIGAKGQSGYAEYNYTQKNYSGLLSVDDELATRMSRGIGTFGHVTGQAGYEEYKYTQNYSELDY